MMWEVKNKPMKIYVFIFTFIILLGCNENTKNEHVYLKQYPNSIDTFVNKLMQFKMAEDEELLNIKINVEHPNRKGTKNNKKINSYIDSSTYIVYSEIEYLDNKNTKQREEYLIKFNSDLKIHFYFSKSNIDDISNDLPENFYK